MKFKIFCLIFIFTIVGCKSKKEISAFQHAEAMHSVQSNYVTDKNHNCSRDYYDEGFDTLRDDGKIWHSWEFVSYKCENGLEIYITLPEYQKGQ